MANEAYRAVFLRVHPTGKMVLSLTTEADGNEPQYAELVAHELGVPTLDVKVVPADTDRFGGGHGYNTAPSPGTPAAVGTAAQRYRDKAQLLAGMQLEAAPDSLTWSNGAWAGWPAAAGPTSRPWRCTGCPLRPTPATVWLAERPVADVTALVPQPGPAGEWTSHLPAPLRIHRVDADHYGLVAPPHTAAIAAVVAADLAGAAAGPRSPCPSCPTATREAPVQHPVHGPPARSSWRTAVAEADPAMYPGTVRGTFDPGTSWSNHTAAQAHDDLATAVALARAVNPGLKTVVTVSGAARR